VPVILVTGSGRRATTATRRPVQTGRSAGPPSFVRIDFVADDAANGGTADSTGRTAAGKNGADTGADTGADSGILILRRHAGTTTQTEQHDCCNYTR